MKDTMKLIIAPICLFLFGCTYNSFLNEPVILGVSSPLNEVTVENNQHSLGTGKLNVFSCSHGIRLLSNRDLAPSPLQFVDRYVKQKLKLDGKNVSLDRFDVYFNRQLPSWKNKSAAAYASLGLLGVAISNEMKEAAMDSGDDVVGCKGELRGEFSVFELGEQPDFESTPIVAHIEMSIDGKQYKGRGFTNTYSVSELIYYVKGEVRNSVFLALEDIKSQLQEEHG